jgi:hypothetical protein
VFSFKGQPCVGGWDALNRILSFVSRQFVAKQKDLPVNRGCRGKNRCDETGKKKTNPTV